MGGDFSKSKLTQSTETKSSRSADNSQQITTENDIHRLAIDQSAVIGSLYDARQDNLLSISLPNIANTSVTPQEKSNLATDSGTLEGRNLLDIIHIDKELCLSICLKIKDSDGVSLLINSPFTTDKYTRFLSYYYSTRQIRISHEQPIGKSKDIQKFLTNYDATHVVTKIKIGVHVVVILQLSPKHVSDLDRLLEKIKLQLAANIFKIEPNEEHFFGQFVNINVFSNMSNIMEPATLADVCRKIIHIQSDFSQHCPLEYTLRPIRSICSLYPKEKAKYVQLNSKHMNEIEPYLSDLLLARKQLKTLLDPEMKQSIENYFSQQYKDVQQHTSEVEELYRIRIDRYYDMLLKIRRAEVDQDQLSEPLINTDDIKLLTETRNTIERLYVLIEKVQLINRLKKQRVEYCNVKELSIDDDSNFETITQQLLNKNKRKLIYCFDDKLVKSHSSEWNNFYDKLITERKSKPKLEFVYADFSFCTCQLPQMTVLPSHDTSEQQKSSWKEPSPEESMSSSKKPRLNESDPPINRYVNVLLLGESGVGKSTFVNAVVNYLRFESLKQARSGEPIALMPVSFLLTVGDQFEERTVKFGDEDPNEDHHHAGQSVTQHCRSYVFTIGTQTKIRFIDTPGMGDTRGLDQDDRNMQHILSFINNLSHLNAICILLKPNESKLNVVFRSYFTRLLGFLGEDIRDNIIFCFTNTRGTFFAPGDTGPLLKKMLDSHSIKNIPFKKTNIFCFDSESFRYLIARQNGIKFDDDQKEEYQRSWVTSVNESTRFLQYICNNLKAYPQKDWRSIEHARCQINQIVRPVLETIRNIIRNMILLDKISSNLFIKLRSKPVAQNSTICLGCTRSPVRVGEFLIIPDELHILSAKYNECLCASSYHTTVDYTLKYELCNDKQKPTLNEMKTMLDSLREMLMNFAYFLKYVVRISKENDPISSTLNRMIDEENYISAKIKTKNVNSFLCNELNNVRKDYDKIWTASLSSRKSVTLPEVYQMIETASESNTINKQIIAIKQTQEMYMNEQEKRVL